MPAKPCFICGKPNHGWRWHDCCVACRRPQYSNGFAPEIEAVIEGEERALHTLRHASDDGIHARRLGRDGGRRKQYLDT